MMSSGNSKEISDFTGEQGTTSSRQQRQQEPVLDNAQDNKKSQMSMTSDEVNYLIFRYMQESGLVHSAFTFSNESMLGRTGLRAADKSLPPGALLTFLQKGLQYIGVEESIRQQQENSKKSGSSKKSLATSVQPNSSLNGEGSAHLGNGDFSLLSPIAISSITRKNPPIQLNVPPAAAAAAVKARLAAEAKISQQLEHRESFSQNFTEPPRTIEAPTVPVTSSGEGSTAVSMFKSEIDDVRASLSPTNHVDTVSGSEPIIKQQQGQQKSQILSTKGSRAGVGVIQQSAALQPPPISSRGGNATNSANNVTSATKRSANDSKRSLKKQKTSKNGEPSQHPDTDDNKVSTLSGLDTLEQAVAKLTAEAHSTDVVGENKRPQQAYSAAQDIHGENDNSHNQLNNESGALPAHNSLETLVNGEISGNGEAPFKNSSIHDSNGMIKPRDSEHDNLERSLPPQSNENDFATKEEDILILSKHQSEVFMCAWNPIFTNLIATGSGDASARIWEMNDKLASSGLKGCKLLSHGIDSGDKKNKDVTTLEWSSDGTLLATGSYDGVARVWDRKGALLYTLQGHQGPIFSLKWNKRGNYLLSGSYDRTIIVWNVTGGGGNGSIEHQFKDHQAPALDVDWKDNTTFASCSTDRTVHIYNVNSSAPIKVYSGHTDEVNAVKWDYSGKLLASCSDDCTAKVWEVDSDRTHPLHDFVSHNQEIYTVKWSPTGPGSPNPHKIPLLATASFDGSIRLWNVQDGSCFRFFNQHKDSVYSVAFSPSGDFLASGSLAGQMYIWNIEEDRYVKSYKGKGDIFEVAWNKEETRVAACFSSNVVAVIDFDRTKLPRLPMR